MLCESCFVGILTGLHERHLVIVDEIIEEPGEELCEPPHAHQIASSRVIFILPAVLQGLVDFFLVVFSVAADHLEFDLLINRCVEGNVLNPADLLNNKRLVLAHDLCLFSHVYSQKRAKLELRLIYMTSSEAVSLQPTLAVGLARVLQSIFVR